MKLLQISPSLIDGIAAAGSNDVTGWGVALLLSISVNVYIYKEFKFIQNKFLDHLTHLTEALDQIKNSINNQN